MAHLLFSREYRAYSILKICEHAARGSFPDCEKSDKDCFKDLTSKLKYLTLCASAQWKPEFEAALGTSHSMRIESINTFKRDILRGGSDKCMACGRNEKNCHYSIDLAGFMRVEKWFESPSSTAKEYFKFREDYNEFFDEKNIKKHTQNKDIPYMDRGCFVIGETCLRKAQLKYLLQTMLLEACYECEIDIQEAEKNNNLEPFTITSQLCDKFVDNLDAIELSMADDKEQTPTIVTDAEFWKQIDFYRSNAAGGNVNKINKLIRERTLATLQMNLVMNANKNSNQYDRDCGICDNEVESCESGDEVSTNNKKLRKRACVIYDNESESGEESECESKSTRNEYNTKKHSKLKQSRNKTPPGLNDIFPTFNDDIVQLMELQTRLAKNKKYEDAAVCTNAIVLFQKLAQQKTV
jgi:hypothetical protein